MIHRVSSGMVVAGNKYRAHRPLLWSNGKKKITANRREDIKTNKVMTLTDLPACLDLQNIVLEHSFDCDFITNSRIYSDKKIVIFMNESNGCDHPVLKSLFGNFFFTFRSP